MPSPALPPDPPVEAQVRDRILVAASHVFAEHGFHESSLNEICDRARSNKPMVYYHFDSKAGLYAAVIDQMLGQLRTKLELNEPTPGTALEKVDSFVRVYAEALAQSNSLTRAVFNDLPSLPVELQKSVLAAYRHRVLSVLERYFGEAAVPELDVSESAHVVSAAIHALAQHGNQPESLTERARWHAVQIYASGALTSSAH